MSIDLKTLTIKKAHEHLTKGDFSVAELSEAYLKNIEVHNKNINAYLEVFDDIKEQTKGAQKLIESKTSGILTGIPIAVKDNILIKGKRASSASKILEGYTATYDAMVIKKLKAGGAVFLGRTNMDEFAMGELGIWTDKKPARYFSCSRWFVRWLCGRRCNGWRSCGSRV